MSSSPRCLFFFQAEDGIRDWSVTGVQTCALPISHHVGQRKETSAFEVAVVEDGSLADPMGAGTVLLFDRNADASHQRRGCVAFFVQMEYPCRAREPALLLGVGQCSRFVHR